MRYFLFATLLAVSLFGADRCASYVQEVRRAHFGVFGVDYPYQYGVAQLKQESGCRDILSNDGIGSQGMAQITYRWWQEVLKKNGILEIRSLTNHFKAQAVIMKSLYKPEYPLWVTYQLYNGGGWVLKEIARAGVVDWEKAKQKCQRGQSCFTMRDGTKHCRSNCDINYEYSKLIYNYAKAYNGIHSTKFLYW